MTKQPIRLVAETTGSLWKIVAQPGEHHAAGAELFVLESMKMEIPVEADVAGYIHEYHLAEGDVVEEGQVIPTLIRQNNLSVRDNEPLTFSPRNTRF